MRKTLLTTLLLAAAACCALSAIVAHATDAPPVSPATQPAPTPPHSSAATQPSSSKSDELNNWILDILSKYQPDVYKQAITLRQSDPKKFEHLINDAVPYFRTLKDKQTKNPPLFQAYMQNLTLNYQALQLAKNLKSADGTPDQKADLKAQLTKIVAAQFDNLQQIRQMEIDEINAKVKQLKDSLDKRETQKDTLVNKRVEDLLKPAPPLNW